MWKLFIFPHTHPDDLLKMFPCFSADHFTVEEHQGYKVRIKSLWKLVRETHKQTTLWELGFILYLSSFNRPSQHLNFWINIQIKMLMLSWGKWGDATWWHLHFCMHNFLGVGLHGASWVDMRTPFAILPALPGLTQHHTVSLHQALHRAPPHLGEYLEELPPLRTLYVYRYTRRSNLTHTHTNQKHTFSWGKASLAGLQTRTAGCRIC